MPQKETKFNSFQRTLARYQKEIDSEIKTFFDRKIKENYLVFKEAAETIKVLKGNNLNGGKRLRPILVIIGYFLAGGKDKKSILAAALSMELLHNYFLIHDDIIDRDELRRGKPSLFAFYRDRTKDLHQGISLAIVAGDIGASLANEAILESALPEKNKIRALRVLNRANILTCHGQMLEMFLTGKRGRASEKDIFDVLKNKTAHYTFVQPLKIGAALAGAGDGFLAKLEKFALPIGIAFQLRDDILGLFGNQKELGKPVASDIKENKPCLLFLRTLELAAAKDKKTFKKYLGQKNLNRKDVKKIRRIVKESGALKHCQDEAGELIAGAKSLIKKMPAPEKEKKFLSDLADYVVKRVF